MAGQLTPDIQHGPVEIQPNDVAAQDGVGRLRQKARRVGLELLEEHAVRSDLGKDLPIRAAGHA